jgi:hypothetical protein
MDIGIKGSNNEPQGTTKMARNERERILRSIIRATATSKVTIEDAATSV